MRIGILGGNGKVGAELALLMQQWCPDVEVVCIVRSVYSTVLFDLAGIPFRIVNFDLPEAMESALRGCDLVFDVTYPTGQTSEIPQRLRHMIETTMAAMRPGSSYVYASSVSAFGMPSLAPRMGDFRIARTSYAQIKRDGEGFTQSLARKYGIKAYVFRLGQTHGYLQAVTSGYLSAFELGHAQFIGRANDLTNTIFVSGVLDALVKCLQGALEPGAIYAIISNPQWSLEQLVRTCIEVSAMAPTISFLDAAPVRPKTRLVSSLRELSEAHILSRAPSPATRIKGLYRVRAARVEAGLRTIPMPPRPIVSVLGECPGRLVPQLQASPEQAIAGYRAVESRLAQLLEEHERNGTHG